MKINKRTILMLLAALLWVTCRHNSPTTPNGNGNHEIPAQMPQVDIPWPSLADSPWPMYLHDPQHTGRSPFRGPQLGELEWSANPAPGYELTTGIAVGPDSTLYFLSEAYLVALNPDGTEKWSFKFSEDRHGEGWPVSTTPLIHADGTICVTTKKEHALYLINQDGSLKQKLPLDVAVTGRQVIGADGTFYAIGEDNHLYAISSTGSVSWNLLLDSGFSVACYPTFSPDGSAIYVAGADSALYAISTSGTLLWKDDLGGRYFDKGLLVDNQGNIYVQPEGRLSPGEIIALNPEGTPRWHYRYSDVSSTDRLSLTMDRNGYLYFVDRSNRDLISLDYSGKLRWRTSYPAVADYIHAPPVCDSEGTVYSVVSFSPSYNVVAFSNKGEVKWTLALTLEQFATDSPPTIGPSGRLYVTGDYEMLFYSIK